MGIDARAGEWTRGQANGREVGRNPDVDSAGVYFVTVEEFEQRESSDDAPEPPPGEQPPRVR
jgi:hypothetical protein